MTICPCLTVFKGYILHRSEVVNTEVQIKLEADPVEVNPDFFQVSFFFGEQGQTALGSKALDKQETGKQTN